MDKCACVCLRYLVVNWRCIKNAALLFPLRRGRGPLRWANPESTQKKSKRTKGRHIENRKSKWNKWSNRWNMLGFLFSCKAVVSICWLDHPSIMNYRPAIVTPKVWFRITLNRKITGQSTHLYQVTVIYSLWNYIYIYVCVYYINFYTYIIYTYTLKYMQDYAGLYRISPPLYLHMSLMIY